VEARDLIHRLISDSSMSALQYQNTTLLRKTVDLEAVIKDKNNHIGNLEAIIKDKDTHIANLEVAMSDKDAYIVNLEAAIKDKDTHIVNLERQRKENYRDWQAHIANLEVAMSDKDAYIVNLETALKEKEATLNYIYHSYGLGSLLVCNKMIDKVFPTNSRRRLFAKIILNVIKNPKSILKRT
jgi:chromosome segregation ATPase